jgi:ribonuclease T2
MVSFRKSQGWKAFCVLTVLAAMLGFASPADARHPRYHHDQDSSAAAQPGDFDFYVFALSIAPSFCDLVGTVKHKAQCDSASDESYQHIPLTIHGLWPNRKGASLRNQPFACTDEKLGKLSDGLVDQLKTYMPGIADDLQDHEWEKHGTCSGLGAEQYFSEEVALAKAANATIGKVIQDQKLFGKQVNIHDLLDAVGAQNPQLAQAMVIGCQTGNSEADDGTSETYLSEIRVLVGKQLKENAPDGTWPADFVPRATAGLRASTGCQGDEAFIPEGFAE